MTNVCDAAAYILQKQGRMSTWKLQKLVYYAQAWHAVWDDEPLFLDPIEAWANGPVCPRLYQQHSGQFQITGVRKGDPSRLTKSQRSSIDAVLKHYAKFNGQQLSDLTHAEPPWRNARLGVSPNAPGNREITLEAMTEYYGSR